MTDAALSAYEAMRQRRIEKNQRMLASLGVPQLPRVSFRSQVLKSVITLEPTRRSSRQHHRRTIAEYETLLQPKIVKNHRNVENELNPQHGTIIADPQHKRQQAAKRQVNDK